MKKKKKTDELEAYRDVRVANMNVEGMPGYVKRHNTGTEVSKGVSAEETAPPVLTPGETGRMIGTALIASLLVAGVFLLAFFLLILFCVKIWL